MNLIGSFENLDRATFAIIWSIFGENQKRHRLIVFKGLEPEVMDLYIHRGNINDVFDLNVKLNGNNIGNFADYLFEKYIVGLELDKTVNLDKLKKNVIPIMMEEIMNSDDRNEIHYVIMLKNIIKSQNTLSLYDEHHLGTLEVWKQLTAMEEYRRTYKYERHYPKKVVCREYDINIVLYLSCMLCGKKSYDMEKNLLCKKCVLYYANKFSYEKFPNWTELWFTRTKLKYFMTVLALQKFISIDIINNGIMKLYLYL